VWTQAAAAVQSLALAALTLAHIVALWEIIAIAINSSKANSARLVGPAIAGPGGRGIR
jgi:hypothetical protein